MAQVGTPFIGVTNVASVLNVINIITQTSTTKVMVLISDLKCKCPSSTAEHHI
jgi:hypothetical protein